MELRIDHMTKQFQDKRAVNDVSLKLTPGVWGLLGANGAGKTTLMRMVAGILQPTKGEIYYDGIEIGTLGAAWRDVFGYLRNLRYIANRIVFIGQIKRINNTGICNVRNLIGCQLLAISRLSSSIFVGICLRDKVSTTAMLALDVFQSFQRIIFERNGFSIRRFHALKRAICCAVSIVF